MSEITKYVQDVLDKSPPTVVFVSNDRLEEIKLIGAKIKRQLGLSKKKSVLVYASDRGKIK